MKTCGTTTLLRCVSTLLQVALKQQGLVLEWMGYSRKNFTFPGKQLFPHSSFDQELQYLQAHSHLNQRLNGAGVFEKFLEIKRCRDVVDEGISFPLARCNKVYSRERHH